MSSIYSQKDWIRAYRALPPDQAHAVRLEFMARLWDVLEPLALTDRARAWLAARGLSPELAHALGWRDWRPAMTRLKRMLEALAPPELAATGFFLRYGNMWWPLADDHSAIPFIKREISTSENMPVHAEGLVAAVWDGLTAHPLGWLWQLYEPITRSPADNCMRQLAGEQPTLLGLHTHRSGLPPPGAHGELIVVEGMLEYLALAQAAAGRAAVLGILRTIHLWHEDWTPFLQGARRVTLVLPDREGYAEQVFAAMEKSAAQRFGPDWTRGRLALRKQAGEDECQALLQRGELVGMIAELL